ncbi:hypothetical protein VPH35_129519 [Triticum aestivum]
MEAGRIGVARHTTPHRSLLLRWSLTMAHLRRDLDTQDPTPHLSFLVFTEWQWQGDDRCVWWTRRWGTISPSFFTSPPFDFPWTLGERRKMADEGMANCIDIILPPLGVFFKFACGVSCPSIVPVLC